MTHGRSQQIERSCLSMETPKTYTAQPTQPVRQVLWPLWRMSLKLDFELITFVLV